MFRKLLLFINLLLFSSFILAENIKKFSCFTIDHLTTSIGLFSQETGDFKLRVNHHNGIQFAPIHKGIITSYDLKHLQKKSEVFSQLTANYNILFTASECKVTSETVRCYTSNKERLQNLSLKNFSIYLHKRRTITPLIDFEEWSLNLEFMVKGDHLVYNSVTEYLLSDCHFN